MVRLLLIAASVGMLPVAFVAPWFGLLGALAMVGANTAYIAAGRARTRLGRPSWWRPPCPRQVIRAGAFSIYGVVVMSFSIGQIREGGEADRRGAAREAQVAIANARAAKLVGTARGYLAAGSIAAAIQVLREAVAVPDATDTAEAVRLLTEAETARAKARLKDLLFAANTLIHAHEVERAIPLLEQAAALEHAAGRGEALDLLRQAETAIRTDPIPGLLLSMTEDEFRAFRTDGTIPARCHLDNRWLDAVFRANLLAKREVAVELREAERQRVEAERHAAEHRTQQARRAGLERFLRDLQSDDPQKQVDAADALAGMGPEAKDAVPALVEAAVTTERAVERAVRTANDMDSIRARFRAADAVDQALLRIGPAGIPYLTEILLHGDNPHVRSSALVTLQDLGAAAKGAVPALLASLDDPTKINNFPFCFDAALALVDIAPGDPRIDPVVPVLIHALGYRRETRWSALRSLPKLGARAEAALPALQKLVDGMLPLEYPLAHRDGGPLPEAERITGIHLEMESDEVIEQRQRQAAAEAIRAITAACPAKAIISEQGPRPALRAPRNTVPPPNPAATKAAVSEEELARKALIARRRAARRRMMIEEADQMGRQQSAAQLEYGRAGANAAAGRMMPPRR